MEIFDLNAIGFGRTESGAHAGDGTLPNDLLICKFASSRETEEESYHLLSRGPMLKLLNLKCQLRM